MIHYPSDSGSFLLADQSGDGSGSLSADLELVVESNYGPRIAGPSTWAVTPAYMTFDFDFFDRDIEVTSAVLYPGTALTTRNLELRVVEGGVSDVANGILRHDQGKAFVRDATYLDVAELIEHAIENDWTEFTILITHTHAPRESYSIDFESMYLDITYQAQPYFFYDNNDIQDILTVTEEIYDGTVESSREDSESPESIIFGYNGWRTDDLTVTTIHWSAEGRIESVSVTEVRYTVTPSSNRTDFVNVYESRTSSLDEFEREDTLTVASQASHWLASRNDTVSVTEARTINSDLLYLRQDTILVQEARTSELVYVPVREDNIVITYEVVGYIYVLDPILPPAEVCSTFPFISFSLDEIVLGIPVVNDREIINLGRSSNETVSGKIQMRAVGSTIERRYYEFESLTKATVDDYVAFTTSTLGQIVQVITHEDERLDVIIDDVNMPQTQQFDDDCGWTLAFGMYIIGETESEEETPGGRD